MSVGYTPLFFRLDARIIGNRLAANDGRCLFLLSLSIYSLSYILRIQLSILYMLIKEYVSISLSTILFYNILLNITSKYLLFYFLSMFF